MQDLKQLNLTEKDFKLLVDGLDCLPHKDMAGEMMGQLMMGLLTKDDPESQEKAKIHMEEKRLKKEKEKEFMMEEVKILQGKLLMLKRYLMENKLLNDAYSIINHVE